MATGARAQENMRSWRRIVGRMRMAGVRGEARFGVPRRRAGNNHNYRACGGIATMRGRHYVRKQDAPSLGSRLQFHASSMGARDLAVNECAIALGHERLIGFLR